jgi:hypothetical protein
MVNGMLHAEKHTRKTNNTSWSPKYAKAVNLKTFWKIALSQRLTHTKPSEEFQQWSNMLDTNDYNMIEITEIKCRL